MKLVNGMLVLLLLSSCSSLLVPGNLDPKSSYPHDLALEINGAEYVGVAAVPWSNRYEIKIEAAGDIDFLTITTCHRQFHTEEVGGSGWLLWKKKNAYLYVYEPTELERAIGCHLEIAALDKSNKTHGFGFVDFVHPSLQLSARKVCNGESRHAIGLTVCEAHAGLEERLEFDVPVKSAAKKGCPSLETSDDKVFEYRVAPGQCEYGFIDDKDQMHRHVTIGFEKLIYRGDE